MANSKIEQAMKRQGYGAAEIADAIQKATFEVPQGELQEPTFVTPEEQNQFLQEDYFDRNQDTDFDDDLTDEDRTYLRLKWGKTYKPEEWIRLEQLYNEMMDSYDIQSAGHIDTLKLICKTSLKANQLIDIGDIEGFQKMSKVYDSLMKSGKFTAAQNKAESGEFVDSISELVEICEKQGFIPRYHIDTPNDKVDETKLDRFSFGCYCLQIIWALFNKCWEFIGLSFAVYILLFIVNVLPIALLLGIGYFFISKQMGSANKSMDFGRSRARLTSDKDKVKFDKVNRIMF